MLLVVLERLLHHAVTLQRKKESIYRIASQLSILATVPRVQRSSTSLAGSSYDEHKHFQCPRWWIALFVLQALLRLLSLAEELKCDLGQ